MTKERVEEKKKRWSKVDSAMAIVLVAVVMWLVAGAQIQDFLEPTQPSESKPADVEIYSFTPLHDNQTLSVEIWLINVGDEPATNIEVFLRARNETGYILYLDDIVMSTVLLRNNETNTGYYQIDITGSTIVYQTLEITWDTGHNVFSRTTNLLVPVSP